MLLQGAGVGPSMLHYVLGITKAYCTRVGGGRFLQSWIGKWLGLRDIT